MWKMMTKSTMLVEISAFCMWKMMTKRTMLVEYEILVQSPSGNKREMRGPKIHGPTTGCSNLRDYSYGPN